MFEVEAGVTVTGPPPLSNGDSSRWPVTLVGLDVLDCLSSDTSALFYAGEHRQVASKVVDTHGNELVALKSPV